MGRNPNPFNFDNNQKKKQIHKEQKVRELSEYDWSIINSDQKKWIIRDISIQSVFTQPYRPLMISEINFP